MLLQSAIEMRIAPMESGAQIWAVSLAVMVTGIAQLVTSALTGSVSQLSASNPPVIVSMVSAVLRGRAWLRTFPTASPVISRIGKAAPMGFRNASSTTSLLKAAVTGSRTVVVRVIKPVSRQMVRALLMKASACWPTGLSPAP